MDTVERVDSTPYWNHQPENKNSPHSQTVASRVLDQGSRPTDYQSATGEPQTRAICLHRPRVSRAPEPSSNTRGGTLECGPKKAECGSKGLVLAEETVDEIQTLESSNNAD
ncbi:hypothetical protein I7I51_04446 [Histoplasma capsulatum]|uniref:Uncharacterized protein n=1 Tax=Ajellomyces capsulatus TaxID=5037 RepID=A0A8A1M8F5_AJECA|nr:hypothetical protein I7I51_04446 [Histoplasma capsulatum]